MSPDFAIAYPGLGQIDDESGAVWTLSPDGTVQKNGVPAFNGAWKVKELRWVEPTLFLCSPTDKWYAGNRSSGSVVLVRKPQEGPTISVPDSTEIPPEVESSREEWRAKVAWDRYSDLLNKATNPTDPVAVKGIADQAVMYGTTFVEAMWPSPPTA